MATSNSKVQSNKRKFYIDNDTNIYYGYVPNHCSLSAFIDILWSNDSRKRHFKRLETFAKYNVYNRLSKRLLDEHGMEFGIKDETIVLDADHKIAGKVRYVNLDDRFRHEEHIDFLNNEYLSSIKRLLEWCLRELIAVKLYGDSKFYKNIKLN